tara:strand:+ start:6885 stop:7031 length:147 start_codon:yes stop_codon:yes gene_type:complete
MASLGPNDPAYFVTGDVVPIQIHAQTGSLGNDDVACLVHAFQFIEEDL